MTTPLSKAIIDNLIEEGLFSSNPYEIVRRIEEEHGIFLTKEELNEWHNKPKPYTGNLRCKSEQKRLATMWGFVKPI